MKMMHLLATITIASAALMLSGCASKVVEYNMNRSEGCYIKADQKKYTLPESRVNYQALTDNAVDVIFSDLEEAPSEVIVTEFVDLTSLENASKFGYVLSNSIKDSVINSLESEVIEAEVAKYFKISGNGLKLLSRSLENIRTDNLNVKHAVVGTYTYTHKETVVFVKLVNLETGIIEGSYSKTLPMNCAMLQLLKEQ